MNDVNTLVLSTHLPLAPETAVQGWLADFETALADGDTAALAALFVADSHGRDVLAFTWHLTPHRGAGEIAAALGARQPQVRARGFSIAAGRTPPRRVKRLGLDVIEALIEFETELGRGNGILRLMPDASAEQPRAWVLLTALEELKGFEEHVGVRRPTGEAYSRNFGGDNWLDQRRKSQAYEDRDPTVLVVGGGQAGLAI